MISRLNNADYGTGQIASPCKTRTSTRAFVNDQHVVQKLQNLLQKTSTVFANGGIVILFKDDELLKQAVSVVHLTLGAQSVNRSTVATYIPTGMVMAFMYISTADNTIHIVSVSSNRAATGTPLSVLSLSPRAINSLMRAKIYTVETLFQMSLGDLACIRAMGKHTKTYKEVVLAMQHYTAKHEPPV